MKTAKEILSEVTGIPEYRMDKEGGEYVTKVGALEAMELYADTKVKNFSSNSMLSDSLLAFNNELSRYADRLPDSVKIMWNEILASNVR